MTEVAPVPPALAESELVLVTAARDGDRAAFDQLVRRYKAPLYRFARRYIGNADDAYDIVQEAFVAAWLGLCRFDSRRAFSTWLRTITLNKCRDHGRRRAARRRVQLLFAFETSLAADPVNRPAAASEREDPRLRQLDQAIAELPRKYKEPLLLTLTAGLSQQQAAVQLDTTTKAIEMRIRRAKKKLGQVLADADGLDLAPEA